MRLIGFSTGALAYSDYREGLRILIDEGVRAVELSALRMPEWLPLVRALPDLDLSFFRYVSIHLPSSMTRDEERVVVDSIQAWKHNWNWPLILHPDAISDWESWRAFGSTLCIENMDIRKPIGRTDCELDTIFRRLPEARLCFDIGHALQVDPTMGQAYWILKGFRTRLTQLHVSEVNSRSKHDLLSYTTIQSFQHVAHLIPSTIPVIMETPAVSQQVRFEMDKARFALPLASDADMVA